MDEKTMYVLLEYNGYCNPHIYSAYKDSDGHNDQIFHGCFDTYADALGAMFSMYEETKKRGNIINELGYELKFNKEESGIMNETHEEVIASFDDGEGDEMWFVYKIVAVEVGKTYDET